MPKQSAAALSVVRVDGRLNRLSPPSGMSKEAAAVFRRLVAAVEPEHFSLSDEPLLQAYCEAIVLQERAAKELHKNPLLNGKLSPWLAVVEKCWRSSTALSLRLRLAPQSRYDARAAHRRTKEHGSVLDEMSLEELQ